MNLTPATGFTFHCKYGFYHTIPVKKRPNIPLSMLVPIAGKINEIPKSNNDKTECLMI